jgi:hypothetical protein
MNSHAEQLHRPWLQLAPGSSLDDHNHWWIPCGAPARRSASRASASASALPLVTLIAFRGDRVGHKHQCVLTPSRPNARYNRPAVSAAWNCGTSLPVTQPLVPVSRRGIFSTPSNINPLASAVLRNRIVGPLDRLHVLCWLAVLNHPPVPAFWHALILPSRRP